MLFVVDDDGAVAAVSLCGVFVTAAEATLVDEEEDGLEEDAAAAAVVEAVEEEEEEEEGDDMLDMLSLRRWNSTRKRRLTSAKRACAIVPISSAYRSVTNWLSASEAATSDCTTADDDDDDDDDDDNDSPALATSDAGGETKR